MVIIENSKINKTNTKKDNYTKNTKQNIEKIQKGNYRKHTKNIIIEKYKTINNDNYRKIQKYK